MVPVLDNPHDNHDEWWGSSSIRPPRCRPRSATSAALRIQDIDPDVIPPQVASLQWYGGDLDHQHRVDFQRAALAASAGNGAAYQLLDLGTSGLAHPAGVRNIGLIPARLQPDRADRHARSRRPLASGHFYRIQVSGSGVSAIRDLAGNRWPGGSRHGGYRLRRPAGPGHNPQVL